MLNYKLFIRKFSFEFIMHYIYSVIEFIVGIGYNYELLLMEMTNIFP